MVIKAHIAFSSIKTILGLVVKQSLNLNQFFGLLKVGSQPKVVPHKHYYSTFLFEQKEPLHLESWGHD